MTTKQQPSCLKKLVSSPDMFKDFKNFLRDKYKRGFNDSLERPKNYNNYNRQLNRIKAYFEGSSSQKRSGIDAWEKYIKHDFQQYIYERSIDSYSTWFKQTYGQEFVPSQSMLFVRDGDEDGFDFRGSFSGEDLFHYIGSLLGVLAGVPVVLDCSSNRRGIDVGVGSSR
jgi:hypothetical protein